MARTTETISRGLTHDDAANAELIARARSIAGARDVERVHAISPTILTVLNALPADIRMR